MAGSINIGIGLGLGHAPGGAGSGGIILPTPLGKAIGGLGDSRTQGGSMVDTTSLSGWFAYALAESAHRNIFVANPSIGGSSTADVISNGSLDAAIASTANTVILLIGAADLSDSLTLSQTFDNYTTILNALAAASKTVILCNELPRDVLVGTQIDDQIARRDWLEAAARRVTWPNIYQVDTFRTMLKVATVCEFKTGYSGDGTHLTVLGNRVLGQYIATRLALLYPIGTWPSLLRLPTDGTADAYHVTNNPTGMLTPSFMMTGTTGSKTGTNPATGEVPTGWGIANSLSGVTIVSSKGTNPDGFDEWVINVTGSTPGTGTNSITLSGPVVGAGNLGNMAAGDLVRASARMRLDAGAQGLLAIAVGGYARGTDGVLITNDGYCWNGSSSSSAHDGEALDYKVIARDFTVPSAWATMTGRAAQSRAPLIVAGSSATLNFTLRLSQMGLRRYAA